MQKKTKYIILWLLYLYAWNTEYRNKTTTLSNPVEEPQNKIIIVNRQNTLSSFKKISPFKNLKLIKLNNPNKQPETYTDKYDGSVNIDLIPYDSWA